MRRSGQRYVLRRVESLVSLSERAIRSSTLSTRESSRCSVDAIVGGGVDDDDEVKRMYGFMIARSWCELCVSASKLRREDANLVY